MKYKINVLATTISKRFYSIYFLGLICLYIVNYTIIGTIPKKSIVYSSLSITIIITTNIIIKS